MKGRAELENGSRSGLPSCGGLPRTSRKCEKTTQNGFQRRSTKTWALCSQPCVSM